MGRRLVQRRAAEEDIAEQVAYLAGERPAVAHRYAIALENAFERLRTMPDVGVLRSYGSRRPDCTRSAYGPCRNFDDSSSSIE
jgi:plasmid stabilization system protein ParE